MKFLFEFFPLLLFFVALMVWDVFVATGVAMAATFLQVGWLAIRRKKIPPMLWASFAIIGVLGSLTLYLRDETFILWKPTVAYWLLASVLAGASLFGRNLVRSLLSAEIKGLPDAVWKKINWAWVAFFGVMGAVNLYVAFNFSLKIWGAFKVFGVTGLIIVFIVVQAIFIAPYLQEDKQ